MVVTEKQKLPVIFGNRFTLFERSIGWGRPHPLRYFFCSGVF